MEATEFESNCAARKLIHHNIIGGSNSITCGCDVIEIARCCCVDASRLSVNKITYQLRNITTLGSEYSLLKFLMQFVYDN